MNLLEYMRAKDRMTQAEWECTFEDGEREILVVLAEGQGASKRNGFWEVSVDFLAHVECETGTLFPNEGRLVYPATDEDHDTGDIFSRFKERTIYRVKVRKKIPEEVPEIVTASSQNQFRVVEVCEENPPCPELEEILAEYCRPIILNDEVLGELTLDKSLGVFEGKAQWRGASIDISLEVNPAQKASWTKARKAMKSLLASQEQWDRDMRACAARSLTANARDWQDSGDDEAPEITEESFAQRIELSSISMSAGGSFTAYFDDDQMFFGHCIMVRGTLKKGAVSAHMGG